MKKLFLFFAVWLMLSCSNKTQQQIEKNITDNAMGADIGYVKGTLEEPLILKYKDIVKIYKDQVGDDVSINLKKYIDGYKSFAEDSRKNNDVDGYWHNLGRSKLFETWNGLKPDDKVYSVYKYTYGINNLFKEGEKTQVTNYYIFDKEDNLITKIDGNDFLDYKKEFIKSPNFGVIVGLVNHYSKPTEELKLTENPKYSEPEEEISSDEAARVIDSAAAVTEREMQ